MNTAELERLLAAERLESARLRRRLGEIQAQCGSVDEHDELRRRPVSQGTSPRSSLHSSPRASLQTSPRPSVTHARGLPQRAESVPSIDLGPVAPPRQPAAPARRRFDSMQPHYFEGVPSFSRRDSSGSGRGSTVDSPSGPRARESDQMRALNSLRESKLLRTLVNLDLAAVASLIRPVHFAEGEVVCVEGEVGHCAYIVAEGELEISTAPSGAADGPRPPTRAGPGEIVGELCAVYESRRAHTVIATQPTTVWKLSRIDVTRALRANAMSSRAEAFEVLRSASWLSALDDRSIWRVADACETVHFEAGTVIVSEGEEGDAMYIVRSGSVVVTQRLERPKQLPSPPGSSRNKSLVPLGGLRRPSYLGAISAGGYFGERALLTNEARSATVEAVVPTVCLMIRREGFRQLLGPIHTYLEQHMPDDVPEHGCAPASAPSADEEPWRPKDSLTERGLFWKPPAQDELSIVKPLGCGVSGAVALVEHAPSCRLFALKVVNKSRLLRPTDVERVRSEKEALLACAHHPCIVQLHATYQDKSTLCLLLEPCCGGELYSLIRDNGRLSEAHARFYAASAVLALRHVHACGFVYRDLKPENLMIDAQGFPRLCDFGLAKRLVDDARAYSSVGTLEYMAPEVIRRSGHTFAADWWSLGVLLFEMIVGRTPFLPPPQRALDSSGADLDEEESAMQLMRDVMACRIYWPEPSEAMLSDDAHDLISRLLRVNLSERLGHLEKGVLDIIDHPWFGAIDMRAIMVRSMTPPFRPELESPIDTSCFDVNLPEFALKLQGDSAAPIPENAMFDDW